MSYRDDYYEDDEWRERVEMFADPGGESALRAATPSNPRNLPCPNCEQPNRLTPADVDARLPVRPVRGEAMVKP